MSISTKNILVKQLKSFPLINNFSKTYDLDSHHGIFIKDSIPYNALVNSDFTVYENYITTTVQPEHSVDIFSRLLNEFNQQHMTKIKMVYSATSNKFVVSDGVHRLSILVYKYNMEHIPVSYFDIIYPSDTVNQVIKVLHSTTGRQFYNGWKNNEKLESGYHSFNIHNIKTSGQRNPCDRVNKFRTYCDFTNKVVYDFGCNTGGMLFHIEELKEGIGFEFDERCIEAGKFIDNILLRDRSVKLVKADLNEISSDYLTSFSKPDIIFLLSLGSWVKNWKDLYNICCSFKGCSIFLETNNKQEGVEQVDFFKSKCKTVKKVDDNSMDDSTGNHSRQLYYIVV